MRFSPTTQPVAPARAITMALAGIVASVAGCQTILGITDPTLAVDGGGGTKTGGDAALDSSSGGVSGGGAATGRAGMGGSGATAAGGIGGSSGSAGAAGNAGAAGASFCESTPPFAFCTDFENRDISGWTSTGGVWDTLNDPTGRQGWVYSGGGGSFVSTLRGPTWTDQTVEAKVYVVQFGGTTGSAYRAGIVARFAGGSSFYTLSIDADGILRLLRGTSTPSGATGTCAAVASGLPTPTATWMTMKLQVSGSSQIRLVTWLNGVRIHDCTSSGTIVTSGTVGVITYGTGTIADFDDVRVTSP